jgi:hypothetical protein
MAYASVGDGAAGLTELEYVRSVPYTKTNQRHADAAIANTTNVRNYCFSLPTGTAHVSN